MISLVEYEDRHKRLAAVLDRSATFSQEIEDSVRDILSSVRYGGDAAVRSYTQQFDGVDLDSMQVSPGAVEAASDALSENLRGIIESAAANIRRFHERQRQQSWFTEEEDGVILGQRIMPIERVGLYVPGGTAFYPSSLLMNAIPAQVAEVPEIALVSPPGSDGKPHPLVLATARLLGLDEVYAVGGAQAIGALAYGTESVRGVDKIVGPGNAYVAAAKKQVFGRVAIDSVAGPSEIVVLADDTADAEFVASDLLSQAEHDVRSSAILVTPSRPLAEGVRDAIGSMVERLDRRKIIEQSLADFGACVVTPSMQDAVDMTNDLAPEHLELHVREPWALMTRIKHAGAIFLGPYSSEPVGDYFAGPNHVLPTGGTARYASALGVHAFIRRQSIISYTEARLRKTGPDIVRFAEAEELTAHARAIQLRLDRS